MSQTIPIRLDERRGCVGRVVLGRLAGLCVRCELQGRPGEQLAPAARRNDDGVTDCPNFRSVGPGGYAEAESDVPGQG